MQLFALAYNLANFLRRLALPKSIRQWSLTTLRERLVKIGAKVTRHSKYVTFQLAKVAVPRQLFAAILERIGRLAMQPSLCDPVKEPRRAEYEEVFGESDGECTAFGRETAPEPTLWRARRASGWPVKPLLGGKIGGPTGIPHNAWLRWRSYRSERIRAASKWETRAKDLRMTLGTTALNEMAKPALRLAAAGLLSLFLLASAISALAATGGAQLGVMIDGPEHSWIGYPVPDDLNYLKNHGVKRHSLPHRLGAHAAEA